MIVVQVLILIRHEEHRERAAVKLDGGGSKANGSLGSSLMGLDWLSLVVMSSK